MLGERCLPPSDLSAEPGVLQRQGGACTLGRKARGGVWVGIRGCVSRGVSPGALDARSSGRTVLWIASWGALPRLPLASPHYPLRKWVRDHVGGGLGQTDWVPAPFGRRCMAGLWL